MLGFQQNGKFGATENDALRAPANELLHDHGAHGAGCVVEVAARQFLIDDAMKRGAVVRIGRQHLDAELLREPV